MSKHWMQEKIPFDPFGPSNAHNEPSTMSTSLTLSRMQSFNQPIHMFLNISEPWCLYSACCSFCCKRKKKFRSMNNGHEQVLVIFNLHWGKKFEAIVNRDPIFSISVTDLSIHIGKESGNRRRGK